MSDLGWRADGIERAIAAGGIELEVYHRPGFTGRRSVRKVTTGGAGSGFPIDHDPDPWDEEWSKRAPLPAQTHRPAHRTLP